MVDILYPQPSALCDKKVTRFQDMEERIAHFADIDTRRAMGFKPRKLPPTDFHVNFRRVEKVNSHFRIDFGNGIEYWLIVRERKVIACTWVHGRKWYETFYE